MSRGAFIVFEGIDRCGKSTQSSMLYNKLKSMNIPCLLMKFPDRNTVIGKSIDNYLSCKSDMEDHSIHLLFSANRWEKSTEIMDCLNAGITIICDRYAYSGVAFTSAKGYDINWCKNPDIGLPQPDIVFYLELSPTIANNRCGFGIERYENLQFQNLVYDKFNDLFDTCSVLNRINANADIDTLHSKILQVSLDTIEDIEDSPINKLWT